MHTIREINYYSGADSDGEFRVTQHEVYGIRVPPSIPGLLNGVQVSLGISFRLKNIQSQIYNVLKHYNSKNGLAYRYELESTLISMKRVTDDLIMSSYCMLYSAEVISTRKLSIDGYGSLFKGGRPTTIGQNIINNFIDPSDSFLEIFSELVNSYKHSYLLPEAQMMWGAHFPTVVSIYAHRNDYSKEINYHNHSLGQIVIGFNKFVDNIIMKQNTHAQEL